MKPFVAKFYSRWITLSAFAVAAALSQSAAAQPNGTTESPANSAKNLARMNCGAKIECFTPDGREAAIATSSEENNSAAALIMDDDTLSCPLPEGQTTFIITLPTTSLVDRLTFMNENAVAHGELKIAVSNYQLPVTSKKWQDVEGDIAITNKRLFNVSIVGVEARYVKLSFKVEKAGRIAALGLYGGETLQRFAQRQQRVTKVANTITTVSRRLEDRLNFNFANLYAKARVVYVSSGSLAGAQRMIDDDNETTFAFAATDRQPLAVLELAQEQRLHRVSARYDLAGGRMEVYLLENFDREHPDLTAARPVASAADRDTSGKAAIDFDAKGARYVALRWTPEAGGSDRSFAVAEVNAFGDVPLAMLQVSEAPELYASNSSAMQMPGEGTPDLSSTLGTLAVPPTLPVVSP